MNHLWGLYQTRTNSAAADAVANEIAADPTFPSRAAAVAPVPATSSGGHPAHQDETNRQGPENANNKEDRR